MIEHYSDRMPLTEDQTVGQARTVIEKYSPVTKSGRDVKEVAHNLVNLIHSLLIYEGEDGLKRVHPIAREALLSAGDDFLRMTPTSFPEEDRRLLEEG
jgi:hypothetical protein